VRFILGSSFRTESDHEALRAGDHHRSSAARHPDDRHIEMAAPGHAKSAGKICW
jgi:hypothetical protein